MRKYFKKIFLLIGLSLISLTAVGCFSNNTSKEKQNFSEVASDKLEINSPTSDESISNTSHPDYIKEKLQITKGLSNLEVVKIKTAFIQMIDELEHGRESVFPDIISNLQGVIEIAQSDSFREDLVTVQNLIQNHLQTGSPTALTYAIQMLNDLTLYGIDYPYDKQSPKSAEGWPQVFEEDQLFNITKSLGNEYPHDLQEIINSTTILATSNYDLRIFLESIQKNIDDELFKIAAEDAKTLKTNTLLASDILFEMRTSLTNNNYTVEALKNILLESKESLSALLDDCIKILPEGALQVEYSRILGYIDYAHEEVQKEEFNYNVILLLCIGGAQESLDDLAVAVLGSIEPYTNKRYSGVLDLLEYGPVLYDWVKHEQTGEYPEGGKPAMDFFGKPFYE
jgi:hypothetical protein